MLPFGVKYKAKHAFSSDDDDEDNDKRNVVEKLNSDSTTSIDKLITKNKKRKEKEKQDERDQVIKKKKQKLERESDTIKELKDRIEMFDKQEEEKDEDDEWEEEIVLPPPATEEEPEEAEKEETEKEEEYIQFTISNNDSNQLEEDDDSPKRKRTMNRKTKKEQLMNCSINFAQLLIYFNFHHRLNEFVRTNTNLQGTILSILEELKLVDDRSIDHLIDTIYKKFKIKKFTKEPNILEMLDEQDEIIENISKRNIDNMFELIIIVLVALIYNNYNIRYCTKLEIVTEKKKKKSTKKNEGFSFETWIEIQHENATSTSENTFKKLTLKNKTYKIEKVKLDNIEKFYAKLEKKSSEVPIIIYSFDYLPNFNYVIRNTTSKYLICKYPNTLIGKENYLRIDTLINNLIYDLNQDLMNQLNPPPTPTIPSSTPLTVQNIKGMDSKNTIDLVDKEDLIVHVIDSDDEDNDTISIASALSISESPNKSPEKKSKNKDENTLPIKNNHELLCNNYSFLNNRFIEIDENILKQIKQLIVKEIPTSLQEFQTHPLYIIEKFISKYDAIYPKDVDPVDKIKTHNIYLREWIKPLHTRDRWLRDEMKKVRQNERPYKIVKASKFSKHSDITELFGEWQTEPYQVPIVNEKDPIPKSDKGVYELWTDQFLPKGCAHISTNNEPLKGLTIVARKLDVDYARAMVGFEFRQKRSIPKYDGIIIHDYNEQKLRREYVKYQQTRLEKLVKKKNDRVLNNWSKLVRAMRAKEYVKHKYSNRKEGVHLHDVILAEENEMSDQDNEDNMEDEEMSSKDENSTTNTVQRVLASGKIVEFEQI